MKRLMKEIVYFKYFMIDDYPHDYRSPYMHDGCLHFWVMFASKNKDKTWIKPLADLLNK